MTTFSLSQMNRMMSASILPWREKVVAKKPTFSLSQMSRMMSASYAPVGHSYFHTPPAASCHPLYLRGGACKPFYRKPFCF